MLHRSFKLLSQTLKKYPSKSLHYPIPSSSFSNLPFLNPLESQIPPENILRNTYVHDHMKNVYKYISISTAFAISSTFLISSALPIGAPIAIPSYLILLGFGLEHSASDYLDKSRAQTYTYKGKDGLIKYGTSNPFPRKMAFLASSLGYSCIMALLLGFTPEAIAVLPSVAIMCISSTLGQIDYCKRSSNGQSKFSVPMLFVYGATAGITGLNLATAGGIYFGFGEVFQAVEMGMSKYIGLGLYNMSIAHDSLQAANEAKNGKGDYIKHANGLSQSWLFALLPFLVLGTAFDEKPEVAEAKEAVEGEVTSEKETKE